MKPIPEAATDSGALGCTRGPVKRTAGRSGVEVEAASAFGKLAKFAAFSLIGRGSKLVVRAIGQKRQL